MSDMHVFFSGIGGTGIGPLALIAKEAGFEVSGSDKQTSQYIDYLRAHGITDIHIGQSSEEIAAAHAAKPIDWFVYSSALPKENPNHPELLFVDQNNIKHSKRDEFLLHVLDEKHLQLVAVAGTHGKTTTTAMAIWLLKELDVPVSYSVGAKIPFGEMGHFDPASQYFVYECDEYDRNMLTFSPHISLITGIDWDHADIYPTREEYYQAFLQFLGQSQQLVVWQDDIDRLRWPPEGSVAVLNPSDTTIAQSKLLGLVNRQNAWEVANAISKMGLSSKSPLELLQLLDNFPGVSRRYEQLTPGLYTDYAHTPPKIRGALQLGTEVAAGRLVVVYEGLHNTRQHFIKEELRTLFTGVKQLYIVPSYLAREDPSLALLSPDDLRGLMTPEIQAVTVASALDDTLEAAIRNHLSEGDLVLCLTAGGGHSLDEWLRARFVPKLP